MLSWAVSSALACLLQDDRNIDGVIILPDNKKRKVLIGSRLSINKVRQDTHESSSALDSAFQKDSEKLALDVNTQAGPAAACCREHCRGLD